MARAIWKGSISFGLVNIPIGLYPATRKEELKFRLLRKNDLSPVNYKRVAEKDGKEVPWDQLVKASSKPARRRKQRAAANTRNDTRKQRNGWPDLAVVS
jgi:non-homologous end joining protein Ku